MRTKQSSVRIEPNKGGGLGEADSLPSASTWIIRFGTTNGADIRSGKESTMTSLTHRGFVHLGMDVSKDAIAVAILKPDSDVAVIDKIASDETSVRRLVKRVGRPSGIWACYEAGPTGYELYRLLSAMGLRCDVVAPSLVPKGPGDKVKTDKRDASRLAGLHRAGELTAIAVPCREQELSDQGMGLEQLGRLGSGSAQLRADRPPETLASRSRRGCTRTDHRRSLTQSSSGLGQPSHREPQGMAPRLPILENCCPPAWRTAVRPFGKLLSAGMENSCPPTRSFCCPLTQGQLAASRGT